MHTTLKHLLPRLLVLAIALGCCGLSFAQVEGGLIQGKVSDSAGALIVGATVDILNSATGLKKRARSNREGLYTVPDLTPGPYTVSVTATGFAREVQQAVTLTVGAELNINFTMQPGSADMTIEVTTAPTGIDMVDSAVNNTVMATTIVELPLNARDWTQLAVLEPSVAVVRTQSALTIDNDRGNRGNGQMLTIGGNRPQQNNYRLDGVSINDYSNGAPGSVLGVDLGVDAIEEFSVITSNANATYGRSSGGIINAITRSGSDKLHGSAYEFFRNSALDAKNYFDLASAPIPPFNRNQYGGALGGPIRRGRTFIFGDYEELRQGLGITTVNTVPTLAARQGQLTSGAVVVDPAVKPFLAFFPLPNGTQSGDTGNFNYAFSQSTHERFFTIRGDHKLSDSDSAFVTYQWDNASTQSPDNYGIKVIGAETRHRVLVVQESHTFTPKLVNAVRFGWNRDHSLAPTTLGALNPLASDTNYGYLPGRPIGAIIVAGLSTLQGGLNSVGSYQYDYDSYQGFDDAFWTLGRHSISFGGVYEYLHADQLGYSNPNGQFTFGSLAQFLTNQPQAFTSRIGTTTLPVNLRQSIIAGYLQDNFKLRDTLTLNLGVRYEVATVPTEATGRLTTLPTLTSATPRVGSPYFPNPTLKNFEPRVGVVWDPFGKGKTSVRAAFGIYDVLPLPYQFQLISILSAPIFQQGVLTPPTVGSFPNIAYGELTPNKLRYGYVDQHPKRNYVMQWQGSVEQQVSPSTSLLLGYVGSRGVHQPFHEDDINAVQPIGRTSDGSYYFPVKGTGIRLNPNVAQLSSLIYSSDSYYHALDVRLTRRLSRGLSAQGSYTWAKSIDTSSASTTGDNYTNSVANPPIVDTRLRRGLSDFDVRHVVVLSTTWVLPSPGKEAYKWPIRGWQLGGIFQANSGQPFTPTISGDPLGLLSITPYAVPNAIGGPGCSTGVNIHSVNYIKTSCFSLPAKFSGPGSTTVPLNPVLGNLGRNRLIGPGLDTLDASAFKNNHFAIKSKEMDVQFRAEFFNILNHSNFAVPANRQILNNSGAPIPSGGVVTGTTSTSRQIQFAAKFTF